MASYKEIVTKAVIGKGKKAFVNNYTIKSETTPSNILGCWVINHNYKGYKQNDKIGVDGSYDINIWYSYEGDSKTAVVNKKINYSDLFNLKINDESDVNETDIIVRTLSNPTCTKVKIEDDGSINFDIEKELGVEIVGEKKIKIAIEEDEDDWEELIDEVDDKVLDEIEENINPNYIEEK